MGLKVESELNVDPSRGIFRNRNRHAGRSDLVLRRLATWPTLATTISNKHRHNRHRCHTDSRQHLGKALEVISVSKGSLAALEEAGIADVRKQRKNAPGIYVDLRYSSSREAKQWINSGGSSAG